MYGEITFQIRSVSKTSMILSTGDDDKNDSYVCKISTFGARNCYGTGNIYKNKSLLKTFRVIQFVSDDNKESKLWDFGLDELIKIEREKLKEFVETVGPFSDSEVNRPDISEERLFQQLHQYQ
eukprot:gene6618-10784_t